MALPTVSSITTVKSNNGGSPSGGQSATITGTNFTGATAVNFGTLPATSFKVESATEIKATVPQSVDAKGNYIPGPVNVFVTSSTNETNAAADENSFVYWPAPHVSPAESFVYETVPIGKVKGPNAHEPVSYLKAGAAETFNLELDGDYSQKDVDNLIVEVSVLEATGTPKLKVLVEDSIDGGATWSATELAETGEVNGVAKAVVRGNLAGKPIGPKLRLAAKFGAAGGVAGTITVATSHA